jgi:hypothetical protein
VIGSSVSIREAPKLSGPALSAVQKVPDLCQLVVLLWRAVCFQVKNMFGLHELKAWWLVDLSAYSVDNAIDATCTPLRSQHVTAATNSHTAQVAI